jgi:hypothetical protein
MNQNHKKGHKTTTMTHHHQHDSVDGSAASSLPSTSNMSTKTYLLLYCKKLQKKQHFHTTISLKSITMAFFLTC